MATVQQELQRGWSIHQQRRYGEAEAIYRGALQAEPNNSAAWCYLGIALHDQKRYAEAVDAYQRAIALRPEFPVALNNLGNTLRFVGDIEKADQSLARAIALKPDYVNAYKNRGTLHVWSGNLDRGMHWYEQGLKINPQEAELHRNLGVIYLLQGRFEEGWREYRWRWLVGDLRRSSIPAPLWDGGDVAGKVLLLTVEQGLGDTLNFVRFSRFLRERGAKTLVHCQAPLVALLQQSPQLGPVYPNTLALETRVDCHCSLVDVADLLQLNAHNIPTYPGYVTPAPQLMRYWKDRLPLAPGGKLRVGIVWQGNPDFQADMYRSVPLREFEVLAAIPGVELVSLQNGFGSEQIAYWQGAQPLKTLGEDVDKTSGAFMDTAAIMKQLDLVITIDTSSGHLACALGVPTWFALSYTPDWRWLLGRRDSPWYPSATLFRQPTLGDWSSPFRQMARELAEWAQRRLAENVHQAD